MSEAHHIAQADRLDVLLRPEQERKALEVILLNPKNRDVQQWAKRRFLTLTEPEGLTR